jgi:hypothetical protein
VFSLLLDFVQLLLQSLNQTVTSLNLLLAQPFSKRIRVLTTDSFFFSFSLGVLELSVELSKLDAALLSLHFESARSVVFSLFV